MFREPKDIALVGEQAFERVLRCAASDSVFVRDAAAGWRLAVGERQQHDPLDSAEPVRHSLMGIAGLSERKVGGGCREVLGLAGLVKSQIRTASEAGPDFSFAARMPIGVL